ncbi:hypothetical protein D3C73_1669470 [compost metagenome]
MLAIIAISLAGLYRPIEPTRSCPTPCSAEIDPFMRATTSYTAPETAFSELRMAW